MTTWKKLLILLLFATLSAEAFAAHIVGGSITYEYIGQFGNAKRFRFTMKVYRDCASGGAPFDDPANIAIYRGNYFNNSYFTDYSVPLASVEPITINEPDCINNLPFLCLEEGTYYWDEDLPISNESYFIVYQRCCRTNAITNIFDPANTGATYHAEVTPQAQQLQNNSPYFNNFPPPVVCNNYPLQVDFAATDPDGDQLVYSFCAPYAGGGNPPGGGFGCDAIIPNPPCPPPFDEINFIGQYSDTQPMAGNPVISIHPQTGIITGTPRPTDNLSWGFVWKNTAMANCSP
jgi:hypothetical protein